MSAVYALLLATLFVVGANASSHPVPDPNSLKSSSARDATSEHDTTPVNTRGSRASYYCEYDYWSNSYWDHDFDPVKTTRARSFKKCAQSCCYNQYCWSFDYLKRSKKCYQYNESPLPENLDQSLSGSKSWTAGAMTYPRSYKP